jgi:hypothetical protein
LPRNAHRSQAKCVRAEVFRARRRRDVIGAIECLRRSLIERGMETEVGSVLGFRRQDARRIAKDRLVLYQRSRAAVCGYAGVFKRSRERDKASWLSNPVPRAFRLMAGFAIGVPPAPVVAPPAPLPVMVIPD